jgi:hypothetical protein
MPNKRARLTLIVCCVPFLASGCGLGRALSEAIANAAFVWWPMTIYVGGAPSPQIATSAPVPFLPLAVGFDRQRPPDTMSLVEFGFIRVALLMPWPQTWRFDLTLEGWLKIL